MERTSCAIVGGGPAGMVLGLLLARAGVDVVVLEKHADFLRDFRGDTVHASTLQLLDEIGLGEKFAGLPQRVEATLGMSFDGNEFVLADFRMLPGKHRHIAFVPQWDLLDLLADEASTWPGFHLMREAEVTDVLRENGAVAGVRFTDAGGETRELYADLVVACDGRHSVLRKAAGLPQRAFGVPLDVLWLRVPRETADPDLTQIIFSGRGGLILIDRDDYWQAAVLVAKGQSEQALADDAAIVRATIEALAPFIADRTAAIRTEDISVLSVRLDRLRRWSAPGVLCIGDAAHAMSPVGGVGINLAIQDAVAAARLLAPALRRGSPSTRDLARVRRRRLLPAVVTQTLQRMIHRTVISPIVLATGATPRQRLAVPPPLRAIHRFPWLGGLTARLIGIGIRPEHATGVLAAPLARSVVGEHRVGEVADSLDRD